MAVRERAVSAGAGLAAAPAARDDLALDASLAALASAGQFQIRDAEASREDLCATLAGVRAGLGERRPAFGCYFNCAGRGAALFGQADHDVALIRQSLGAFPLIGFFGNGELAPVGRRNQFHTYTGALVVFPG